MRAARHKENKRQTSLLKQLIGYTNLCIFGSFARTARCLLGSLHWSRRGTLFLHYHRMWEAFIKGIGSQEMTSFVAIHPRIPCALSERGFQKSPQDSSEVSRSLSR